MDDIIETIKSIRGTLEPIADLDFHGKWRIRRAMDMADSVIERLSNKHPLPDTLDPAKQREANAKLWDEVDALSTQNTEEK